MNEREIRLVGNVVVRNWKVTYYNLHFDNRHNTNLDIVGDLDPLLTDAETHFTKEFKYLRVGFAFKHTGRRGETLSLWHWGLWGDTLELFNHGLYLYKNKSLYETLGLGEPAFSIYDLEIMRTEMSRVKTINLDLGSGLEELRCLYE